MGWNELSDPDMRTANFEFSCDVYREGVYRVSSHHNINFTIWKLLILKLAKDYRVECY